MKKICIALLILVSLFLPISSNLKNINTVDEKMPEIYIQIASSSDEKMPEIYRIQPISTDDEKMPEIYSIEFNA